MQPAPRERRDNAHNQPACWRFAALSPQQLERRAAMERKARAGCLARWPAGLTHLPGVRK